MTEEEWQTCEDDQPMLRELGKARSARKFRLYCAGCCRLFLGLRADQFGEATANLGEAIADGEVTEQDRKAVKAAIRAVLHNTEDDMARLFTCTFALSTINDVLPGGTYLVGFSARNAVAVLTQRGRTKEATSLQQLARSQPPLLRCIFGNPFRPVAFAPSWRSETAVALAAGIYEERAFDRLPILADALEEAGCDHPDVLSHCRGPGSHARGCWVVDGVLGKQ